MSDWLAFLATVCFLLCGFEPAHAQGFSGGSTGMLDLGVPKVQAPSKPSAPAALPAPAPVAASSAANVPCPDAPIFDPKQKGALKTVIGIVDPESFLNPPNHFGLCHNDASTLKDDAEKAQAAWVAAGGAYESDRGGKKRPKINKAVLNGGANDWQPTTARTEDYMAYEIMMRTLAAEVGNERDCPPAYQKAAARVILNRIADLKARKPGASALGSMNDLLENIDVPDQGGASVYPMDQESRDGLDSAFQEAVKGSIAKPKQSGLEKFIDDHPIVPVVLDKRKFISWNPRSKAYGKAVCPAEKYGLAPLRRISRIAANAIFREDDFRKETANVTASEYSTGEWIHMIRVFQGYIQVKPKVDGVVIDSLACIQLWRAPEKPNKYGPKEKEMLRQIYKKNHNGQDPEHIL